MFIHLHSIMSDSDGAPIETRETTVNSNYIILYRLINKRIDDICVEYRNWNKTVVKLLENKFLVVTETPKEIDNLISEKKDAV